jgi:signal transduction histidine kinase
VTITFSPHNVPASLSQELTLCLFRIVQEALTNAIKHGGAHEISVRLDGGSEGLELAVVDDGAGFDVGKSWGHGLGLISMAERLRSVGGRLDIRSSAGAGTRVEVLVPWPLLEEERVAV